MVGPRGNVAAMSGGRVWAAVALVGSGLGGGAIAACAAPVAEGIAAPKAQTWDQHDARLGTVGIADRPSGPAFRVEIARSPAERARGLMFRHHLAPDAGMIFLMGSDADWSFWMRDTFISLDMVFIDAAWTVVGVLEAVPPRNDLGRSSGRPSRYVLELAAHQARVHGIVPGTRLVFAEAGSTAAAAPGVGR